MTSLIINDVISWFKHIYSNYFEQLGPDIFSFDAFTSATFGRYQYVTPLLFAMTLKTSVGAKIPDQTTPLPSRRG